MSFFNKAVKLFHDGDHLLAEKICLKILDENPQNCDVLHLLGLIYFKMQSYQKSEDYFLQALNLLSPSPYLHLHYGLLLHDLCRYEEAIQQYNLSLKKKPDFATGFFNLGVSYLALGLWNEALLNFDKSIFINKEDSEAYNNRGVVFQHLNNFEEALKSYEEAIILKPDYAEAFYNKGVLLYQNNRLNDALKCYDRAIVLNQFYGEAFYKRGILFQDLKNFDEALQCFDKAIKLLPQNPEIFCSRGIVFNQLGKFSDALKSYEIAINLNPDYVEAYSNRGITFNDLGHYQEAIECYNRALSIKPNYTKALNNRGVSFNNLKKYDDALLSFNKAIVINFENAESYCNRGVTFNEMKRFPEALESFNRAITLKPNFTEALVGQGVVFQRLMQFDSALISFEKALSINSEHADAWRNRAFMLEQLKRNDEATYCFERFLKLRPDASYAYGYLHSSRMHLCDWHYFEKDSSTILQHIDKNEPVITPHGLFLLSSTRAQQKKAAEMWCADQFKNFISTSFPIDRKGNERIRIAYFSSDFHSHPVGILTARLFELHDREKFEVYAFSSGIPSRDPVRMRIEGGVDHFINVREMSDFEMVDLARAENIDIAIDMTGYTADNRAAAFALRLAPIQVNYLGYSGTMGAAFMDYIIGDPVLIPPDHENDYSEKIARLPDCYMPSDPTREVSERSMTRSEFGLPEDGFIFCAFNNPYKITPPQFDLWMQILKSVPKSVLWLSPTSQKAMENLCHEARKRGVEPSRLVFSKRMNQLSEHLARQQLADLFLDTLPHNAHATSNDALWAGLPILTRLGEGFAGRVAGSLLTAVGMPDMIMPNSQSYVARAIEIATTPGLSAKLKARLAENKKKMPLFDAEKYTRNLEKAYLIMHDRRINGLAPVSLDIKE